MTVWRPSHSQHAHESNNKLAVSHKCSHPLIPIFSPEIREGIDTYNARYFAGRDRHVLR